jgi:hypothetical protein
MVNPESTTIAPVVDAPANGVSSEELSAQEASYEKEFRDYFENKRKSLKILATTKTPMGQTVDWIPRESQGTIASPPPSIKVEAGENVILATPELEMEGAERGPEGTVPVLRKNLDAIKPKEPLAKYLNKVRGARPGMQKNGLSAQAGGHRYGKWVVHIYNFTDIEGSSQQSVNNYGGSGNLSYWNPYVQTNQDFSLLQIGIINTQQGYDQTAEAGWQVFQQLNGDFASHLFTYFTVNGYTTGGDNLGGYDRDVAGWVQYSSTVFPGTVFTPYSSQGGTQTSIGIRYQLYQGNWWLAVNGAFIGYYPASLYAKNGSTNGTLGNNGTGIGWWGEVYDDGTQSGGRTTTDMGSGQFPSAGWTYSAFMNNLTYQSDTNGTLVNYNGANGIVEEDPDMYQIQGDWNSGSSWGSYAWVGGPGSG